MTENIPELYPPALPKTNPFDMALIIDGKVYQVMNVDGQTAAAFLADHIFVQIEEGEAQVGWDYDAATQTFSKPATEPTE